MVDVESELSEPSPRHFQMAGSLPLIPTRGPRHLKFVASFSPLGLLIPGFDHGIRNLPEMAAGRESYYPFYPSANYLLP